MVPLPLGNSKRGSAMMEAALVFPLVIIIAVTMLGIMTGIYSEAAGCAERQMALRQMAGEELETCKGGQNGSGPSRAGKISQGEIANGEISEIFKSGYRTLRGSAGADFGRRGVIHFSASKGYILEETMMDEEMFVRLTDAGRLL